jgi:hypothetical protein
MSSFALHGVCRTVIYPKTRKGMVSATTRLRCLAASQPWRVNNIYFTNSRTH